jgi:hypothetical protein
MELAGSSAQEAELQELVGLLALHNLTPTYSLQPSAE